MPFTINEKKSYEYSAEKVYEAALGAVEGLEGKIENEDKPSGFSVKFNKTIHGKVLGERTQVNVKFVPLSDDKTEIKVEAFPLDALGRKLMFGARKGVTRTVTDWFYAHLEHRLK